MLGIIAGDGALPNKIAIQNANNGKKCVIAAIVGDTNLELIKDFDYNVFKIGEVGSIINYFRQNHVTDLVLAGKITRPNFKSIKVDAKASILIAKILKNKFLGDDLALNVVANFIEEHGFKVISPESILSSSECKIHTNIKASKQDIIDIELGMNVLNAIGDLDVGQSVITSNGYVIGIEAAEGTDQLIARCSNLIKHSKPAGVLVKTFKKSQDLRFDIPTIGINTMQYLVDYHYCGVAIDKNHVMILDAKEVVNFANQHKLFIHLID
ncbi:MAG: LpxI family protein [Rickettsiaceae bacterium]